MTPFLKSKPYSSSRPSPLSYQLLALIVVVAIANVLVLQSSAVVDRHGDGGRILLLLYAPSSNSEATTIEPHLSPSTNTTTMAYSQTVPYYLHGKTKYKEKKFHRKKTFEALTAEVATPITNPSQEKVWILPHPIKTPTRNHESLLLEYGGADHNQQQQYLITVLGRYSRVVQWMDLQTGKQYSIETSGTDPDNRPLNDLNHVASVLVDNIDNPSKKEIWLPCGFHNDRIGKEQSSTYVRIIDVDTMQVRYGPKLPYSGGACGAAPIVAIPGEQPLICAFGGTDGNHDTGELD